MMLMLVTKMPLKSSSGIVTAMMMLTPMLLDGDGDGDGNALVRKGVKTLRCVI